MFLPATIAAMITDFNEMYPGQPATREYLELLLVDMRMRLQDGNEMPIGKPRDGPYLIFGRQTEDEDYDGEPGLVLYMNGPVVEGVGPACVAFKSYKMSANGLLCALVDGKEFLKRYHRDGVCAGCATPSSQELNLPGRKRCVKCEVQFAMGFRKDTV